MSNQKSSALLLTVGTAIALTVGGAAVAYWFWQRQPAAKGEGGLAALSMVPETALAAVSISTDTNQWQQARSLGTVETQTQFNRQLSQWRDRLLTENGLSYQDDVQPWVGDKITLIVFPPDEAGNNLDSAAPDDSPSDNSIPEDSTTDDTAPDAAPGSQDNNAEQDDALLDPELIDPTESQPPVLLVPIADPLKARSTLQSALEGTGEVLKQDYNGVEIQEFSGDNDQPYFATVLDSQMIALTTNDALLEQVIDTYQQDSAVAVTDIPGYNQALAQISDEAQSFIDVYINSSAAAALAAANTVQATPPQGLEVLQDGQGVVAGVSINPDGFTIKGLTWLKEDAANPYKPEKATGQVLEKLPQDTLVMVAGSNFKKLWETLDQRASEGIKGPLNPQTIRSGFQSMTGLDIDSDLVDWMTGGFALALIAAPETADAAPPVGLLMMAESGDRPTADKTFTKLDEVMRDRYKFQVTSETIGNVSVTDWAAPFASLVVTRGWLENNTAVITLGNIVDNVVPKPSTSLAADPIFQQVTASETGTANGYFFINLEALLNGKNSLPIPPLPPNQASTLEAIRAIGFTTTIQDEQTSQFNVTVITPQLASPGTLPDLSSDKNASPEDESEAEK